MNKVDVHRAWARPEGQWSPWVKPILFAALADHLEPRPLDPPPEWLTAGVIGPLMTSPAGASYGDSVDTLADTAVVVDLPGAEGTLVGIGLARQGFAPVPLYNGLWDEPAVIDMRPIMDALVDGADTVRDLPAGAPPAFLLDTDRLGRGCPVRGGDFDNRWFCAPIDFPSANALWETGLRRLVLIQRDDPGRRPIWSPPCSLSRSAAFGFYWRARGRPGHSLRSSQCVRPGRYGLGRS
jgi:hypothetical protein